MAEQPMNGSKLEQQEPMEYWWDSGNSSPAIIEEERALSEYDCGYMDLGAETPSTYHCFTPNYSLVQPGTGAGLTVPHILSRRNSFHLPSSPAANRLRKYSDRDCGICFEYAVVPCRTLCCGKVFCTEHLADWLHGPKAQGRCPNCENACSLASGTLSLASPTIVRRHSATQPIHPSPSTLVQQSSNAALVSSKDQLYSQVDAATSSWSSSPSDSTYSSSTVDYSDTTVSAEELNTMEGELHVHHPFQKDDCSSSFRWGVVSRLLSILIFLVFLYKIQS